MNLLLSSTPARQSHYGGYHLTPHQGQTSLSLVMVVGGISVLIAVSLSFLASSFLSVGYGFEAGERALAAARAGADDAFLQVVRNENSLRSVPRTYALSVTGTNVSIETTPSAGGVIITASSTVLGRTKRIQIITSINSSTGVVTPSSTSILP